MIGVVSILSFGSPLVTGRCTSRVTLTDITHTLTMTSNSCSRLGARASGPSITPLAPPASGGNWPRSCAPTWKHGPPARVVEAWERGPPARVVRSTVGPIVRRISTPSGGGFQTRPYHAVTGMIGASTEVHVCALRLGARASCSRSQPEARASGPRGAEHGWPHRSAHQHTIGGRVPNPPLQCGDGRQ